MCARAARGRLAGTELLEILDTLVAAGRARDALRDERPPLLHELGRVDQAAAAAARAAGAEPRPGGRAAGLRRHRHWAGCAARSASPTSGCARGSRRLVHSKRDSAALQEPIITLRNGRYVDPRPRRCEAAGSRASSTTSRGAARRSSSSRWSSVELGNAWREAQLAAQAEEERILDELSALVDRQADALDETLAALATFDFWIARARLAGELDAIRPETVSRGGRGAAVGAPSGTRRAASCRSTSASARSIRALVITGPNTGGKTVALRTLGLLALMHQSGLHVPAAPRLAAAGFRDVFADIGDEQSIAQSLSTFSGHMRSIVRIVEEAGPGCLVLLDELGAGTDPTEGSALAQALLDHFIAAGALVAATTHYAELKAYAHNTPAAPNASVEFDLETLSPTYQLQIGLPGHHPRVRDRGAAGPARRIWWTMRASRLGEAQEEFEQTLASIKEAQLAAEDALARAAEAEERARTRATRGGGRAGGRAARTRDGDGRRARGGAPRAGRGSGRDNRRARAAGADDADRGAAR